MFHRNISTKSWNNSEKFSKEYYSNISPNKDSLGNIIKLFKSFFTKNINSKLEKIFFAWQDNYYERIIRDDKELFKIRLYIENNPKKWEIDKKQNIWIFM